MLAPLRMVRAATLVAVPVMAVVLVAGPAGACAGLVGENGTISLVRTSTLAAYHDGVERYVTSFQFTGEGEEVGSIVPLPDVPTKVERGGDWTLQRLQREVAPPVAERAADFAGTATLSQKAEVLLTEKIDALDITVLRGGGDAVGEWALEHGYFLSPDAPEVLDFYAQRSPVFMAARFDASRAARLGQGAGDGTPIMVTIPTDEPWVPLRILSLGLDGSKTVDADVFVLTDDRPKLLAGGPGLTLERDEAASPELLADLRSDKGMTWVPDSMWFTYLRLQADAKDLDYDLAVSAHSSTLPTLVDAGIDDDAAQARLIVGDDGAGARPWVLGAIAATVTGAALALLGRRRRTASGGVPQ